MSIGFLLAGMLLIGNAFNNPVQGQTAGERSANSSVYIELGGNALLYSINYDHRFGNDWGARGGLMRAGISDVSFTIIPLMGHYFIGTIHHLELGAGLASISVSVDVPDAEFAGISESTVAGTFTIGYRYQRPEGGLLFRTGLTPLVGGFGTATWAGLSVGYSF